MNRRVAPLASGFTLAEVLIGLAIAGIALTMVLETVATGLRSARTGATGERALVLARSLIDLAASSPVAGTTSGQTASALTWTTQTRPLATAQIRPPGGGAGETPPSVTLFVIETRVHWTGGGEVVLTTERLAAGTGAAP